jgi:hypothetical protein
MKCKCNAQEELENLRLAKVELDLAQTKFWNTLLSTREAGATYDDMADKTGFTIANIMYHLNKVRKNDAFYIGKVTIARPRKK